MSTQLYRLETLKKGFVRQRLFLRADSAEAALERYKAFHAHPVKGASFRCTPAEEDERDGYPEVGRD